MRVNPAPRKFRILAPGLCALVPCALVAVPAAAATPVMTVDMTHQMATVWVPATVYGLTLIAALNKIQK